MDGTSIAAIRAWTRLDQALAEFNRVLEREFGVTGAQLAVLRLTAEWTRSGARSPSAVPLSAVRERLVLHPATVGQLLDRLAQHGLLVVAPDPADRRRRLVSLTEAGTTLLQRAPVAGPVRLRQVNNDPDRLGRLTAALQDAIGLFGLEEYTT